MTLVILVYIYTTGWLAPQTTIKVEPSIQQCMVEKETIQNKNFSHIRCATITIPE